MVTGILSGRPAGGKTGSSEHNATETFVGFTAQVAAAGIATNPDDPRDYVGSSVSAAVDTAVARTMAAALKGQPTKSFPTPKTALAFGFKPSPTAPAPTTGGPPYGRSTPPVRTRGPGQG
jgi:membrane peptidoglycan carboxypeptidase